MADAATESIKGLIKAFGPEMFAIGLNNASMHGDVFKEMDLNVTDNVLGAWYKGIEALTYAGELIDADNS